MKRQLGAVLTSVATLLACRSSGALEITRGPYLQVLLETSAEVLWVTDAPSLGRVRYRPEGGPTIVAVEEAEGTKHRLKLSGLAPGLTHNYEILAGDQVIAGGFRFRTSPPSAQGTVRFAVIGDSGSRDENQLAVATVIEEMAPDLFLHTGDMIYVGDFDTTVFTPYRTILANACFYPTWGNHDLHFVPLDYFVPPTMDPENTGTYYSFDWASAHFVALNTNLDFGPESTQIQWLIEDLRKARASPAKWIILYFHECVYTVGAYSSFERKPRAAIPPIADSFRVDLVLTGHDHNYQRTHPIRDGVVRDAWMDPDFVSPDGTIYIVTGGGGGILYLRRGGDDEPFVRIFESTLHAVEVEIAPSRLSVRAVDPYRRVVDAFAIRKDAPRPAFEFVRGDADSDGKLLISDPIRILVYLFLGGGLDCLPAAEPTGDGGKLNIADPIYLLNFLFLGGPPPAPPFPKCGIDPSVNGDGCIRTGCRK